MSNHQLKPTVDDDGNAKNVPSTMNAQVMGIMKMNNMKTYN